MGCFLLLGCLAVPATQGSAEDLLRQKLKSPFLSRAPWTTDYEKAKEASERSGKPILAYFTLSYAPCTACTQLEGGLLLRDDFAKLAERFVLFCHITSQVPGEKYQTLLAEKGGQGWPSIFFLDPDGDVLARHAGSLTVEGFEATGQMPRAFVDLRQKAAKGGPPAKIDFILAKLELGHLKPGEAQERIRETGGTPSPDQKKKLDGLTANWDVEAILKTIKTDESKQAAARRCYERRKSGKASPTTEPWRGGYWNLILEYAESVKDVEVFEEALGVLKEKYSGLPNVQKYLIEKEASLRRLKGTP